MDDSGPLKDDWIQQWIEQQRSLLRERSAEQRNAGASEAVRQQLLELGTRWLDVGQAYLTGLQQFSAGAQSSAAGPATKLGEEFLNSWRGHWQSAAKDPPSQHSGPSDSASVWSDVLRQLPPLGLGREHHAALRELAQAHAECQRLEQALRAMLFGVQSEALNLLERRLRERQSKPGQPQHEPSGDGQSGDASGASKLAFRELYDLWVECGEQVYAQVAHSEAYCRLQAQLGNATMQLRSRQQKLIEHALKQFDLPTRSELNSMHRQLREQARLLRELQSQLAAAQARSSDAQPTPRARSKRKTS